MNRQTLYAAMIAGLAQAATAAEALDSNFGTNYTEKLDLELESATAVANVPPTKQTGPAQVIAEVELIRGEALSSGHPGAAQWAKETPLSWIVQDNEVGSNDQKFLRDANCANARFTLGLLGGGAAQRLWADAYAMAPDATGQQLWLQGEKLEGVGAFAADFNANGRFRKGVWRTDVPALVRAHWEQFKLDYDNTQANPLKFKGQA